MSQLLVLDPRSRLGAEIILQHSWFSNDVATVTQARLIMGVDKSERDDGSKGSSVGRREAGDYVKR